MSERARSRDEIEARTSVEAAPSADGEPSGARVVYLRPAIALGRIVGRTEGGWTVRVGGAEIEARADACVSAALLEEARLRGTPVVLDGAADQPTIVGALATQRSLDVDDDGVVAASVRRIELHAREGVQLKTDRSFLSLGPERLELFADRVVTRAKRVAKILAAVIELN